MGGSRRDFLKTAGASLALLGGLSAESLAAPLSEGELFRPGEPLKEGNVRWAMVVDLKKCAGKDLSKLFEACHKIHNVPDMEREKDKIKWIWSEPFGHAFPNQEHEYVARPYQEKTVPVMCNHCERPPCVRVCPTQATFKREDGIVMMDMHRCIGCRYCIVACPYGSRSFNWRNPRPYIKEINPEFPTRTKGVVEKCNFCAERIARGKEPACVEACTDGALVFDDINDPNSKVRQLLETRYSIRRKPVLGTMPHVFYLV